MSPSPPHRPPSPSRHLAALTLDTPATPHAPLPTSPSPAHQHVKIPHLHAEVDAEDGHDGPDDDGAVPHKRARTDADHADVALGVNGRDAHIAAVGPVVKEEPAQGVGVLELARVKQEPLQDVAVVDVNMDGEVASGVKSELAEVKQEPSIDAVPGDGGEQTAAPRTRFVYRSVYATKPDWDRFVPVVDGADFQQYGPHCALRSSGTESTATVRTPEDHVLLEWHEMDPTMFISFSLDLAWSVYFQLKHEYFHFKLGHNPIYAESMEWRDMYALEIPEDDLYKFVYTHEKAIAYSNTMCLLLGRLDVPVLRHERVVISDKLRRVTMEWCEERRVHSGLYPYADWHSYVASHAEKALQAVLDPVPMWEEGKSDEDVAKVIEAGLEANKRPASDFIPWCP